MFLQSLVVLAAACLRLFLCNFLSQTRRSCDLHSRESDGAWKGNKCSREMDLKSGGASAEQLNEFSVDGFPRPCDEASTVVFEVLPGDLDQIQLGTVRRQIEQECLVFEKPAVQCVLINAVMDARVVEHEHGRAAITVADQGVEKFNDIRAFHRFGARGVDEAVVTEVKRAYDAAFAMAVGLDAVGQSPW